LATKYQFWSRGIWSTRRLIPRKRSAWRISWCWV